MAREEIEKDDEIIALPILHPNEQNRQQARSSPDLAPNQQGRRENHNGTEHNGANRSGPQFDPLRYLVPALVWFAVIFIFGIITQLAVTVLIYLRYIRAQKTD